jgi:4-hydroxybenzoate polyprenyltransferase
MRVDRVTLENTIRWLTWGYAAWWYSLMSPPGVGDRRVWRVAWSVTGCGAAWTLVVGVDRVPSVVDGRCSASRTGRAGAAGAGR